MIDSIAWAYIQFNYSCIRFPISDIMCRFSGIGSLPMKRYHPPTYILALCTLLSMLILIFVGGLVTSTDAGMAVPDWPTTFGENMFLYPLDRMISGLLVTIPNNLVHDLNLGVVTKAIQKALSVDENILSETAKIHVSKLGKVWKITDDKNNRFYTILNQNKPNQDGHLGVYVHGVLFEHSHRLLGSFVGLLAIATLLSVWLSKQRCFLKWLSALSLFFVIIQGILGGLRVIENSVTLAIIHASFAPVSLAFFAVLTLSTSKNNYQPKSQILTAEPIQVSRLSIFTLAIIYVQLVLGAIVRQTTQYLIIHILVAILVALHIVLLVRKVFSHLSNLSGFINLAMIMGAMIILQMTLGIGAWYSEFQLGERLPRSLRIIIASSHHFSGILLFMTSLTFTFEVLRYTKKQKMHFKLSKRPASSPVQSTT